MNIQQLRKSTKLPLSVLKNAFEMYGRNSKTLEHALNKAIQDYAISFKNNVTKFKTFGYFVSEDHTSGVVLSLVSETNSTITRETLSDYASFLAKNIHNGICVEEYVDTLLNGVISYLGENITLGSVYHFNKQDDGSILIFYPSYLNGAVITIRLMVDKEKFNKAILHNLLKEFDSFFRSYNSEYRRKTKPTLTLDECCISMSRKSLKKQGLTDVVKVSDIKIFGM